MYLGECEEVEEAAAGRKEANADGGWRVVAPGEEVEWLRCAAMRCDSAMAVRRDEEGDGNGRNGPGEFCADDVKIMKMMGDDGAPRVWFVRTGAGQHSTVTEHQGISKDEAEEGGLGRGTTHTLLFQTRR